MKPTVVIPCAKSDGNKIVPFDVNTHISMVPLNGKPVIGWILDYLYESGFSDVILVVKENKEKLVDYVKRVYSRKMSVRFTEPDSMAGPSCSIKAAEKLEMTGDLLVVLGDTIFRQDMDLSRDFVLYSETDEHRRWCLVEAGPDGTVSRFIDKPENYDKQPNALIGVYYLRDAPFFFECIERAISSDDERKYEISLALDYYMSKHRIHAERVEQWFDCGNIDNYYRSKKRLLQSREFNTIDVDDVLGVLTKKSRKSSKFRNEINWYLSLPKELKVLSPRVIDFSLEDNDMWVKMEYYGYTTLSDYFVYENLPLHLWRSVFRHIFEVIEIFSSHKGKLDRKHFDDMYVEKTKRRTEKLKQDREFKRLLSEERISINGVEMKNYPLLEKQILEFAGSLYDSRNCTIIHGDLCFPNILYDLNNRVMKLVDPRGSFGREGIHGDIRYDLAKLLHSVEGKYDFIINNLFSVSKKAEGQYKLEIYSNSNTEEIKKIFTSMLKDYGWDLKTVRFIEGLLFLSMIPLHNDSRDKQTAMYLNAIRILNEVLDENSD